MSSCQDLMYHSIPRKPMGACFCINPQCGRVGRCLRHEIVEVETRGKWPEPKKVDDIFKTLVGEIDKETEEVDNDLKFSIAWYMDGEWYGCETMYDSYEGAEEAAKEDLMSDGLCEKYQILSTIAYVERPPVTEAVVRRVMN